MSTQAHQATETTPTADREIVVSRVIDAPRELVFDAFLSVLMFAAQGSETTRIELRTVFPTKELRDEAAEKYHAIEGGRQTLAKLAAYVTSMARAEREA